MKNNILIILCSSTLLLTACGGGSDSSNSNDLFQGIPKIDYTKPESIELIYEPIITLSQEDDNIVLIGTEFAESLYYSIHAGNNFKCSEGSYTKNSDKSITFNKCQFLDFDNNSRLINLRLMTISGSINSKEILSTDSVRYETTLKNFKIIPASDSTITYNGNIISQYRPTSSQYQIKKMSLNVFDEETQKTQQLIISNYQLNVNNLMITALGNVEGNPNNKYFSVNFKSDLKFENDMDKRAFYPNFAEIIIEDTNNIKNSIKISNTSNYKSLIHAYADGKTVTGYPKTVEWDDLN
ncbi:hypothetical protein [Acinetobacter haemolyticus]|uniref:hypothetical protein n=1 Tax=Acinetobacter haemolyticus TaxID=29430 RepID=UPI0021CEF03D|nr:hypothetical protein [Acinetobacter haemolyticus]MCU4389028.1 hypothetical protein [Acinetobacter haemolyticus]MEB6676606.1 hypothetical protein [Acinetobacter haemolyticus]